MATSSAHIPSEFRNPNLEVLLSEEQLQTRIKELGAEITRDYAGLNPLLIGVLKGACFFLSDLPAGHRYALEYRVYGDLQLWLIHAHLG